MMRFRASFSIWNLATIAFVAVLFSGANSYLSLPVFDSMLWLGIGGVALLARVFYSRQAALRLSPIVVWTYCLVLLVSNGMLYTQDFSSGVETLREVLVFCIVLLLTYALLYEKNLVRHTAMVLLGVNLLSVGNNLYEFFHPGTFSEVLGRSAGFYKNPNTSGLALVIGMALTSSVVPARLRLPYQLSVGLGVLTTLSRGSLVCWAVVFLILQSWSRDLGGRVFWQSVAIVGVLIPLLVVTPVWNSFESQFFDSSSAVGRQVGRLQMGSDSRIQVAETGYDNFMDEPFWGHGTGQPFYQAAGGMALGTHNTYLSLAVQHGILGLILLPSLGVVMLLHRRVAATPIATVAAILIAAFFSHLVIAQWPYAIALAISFRFAELMPRICPSDSNDSHSNCHDDSVIAAAHTRVSCQQPYS